MSFVASSTLTGNQLEYSLRCSKEGLGKTPFIFVSDLSVAMESTLVWISSIDLLVMTTVQQ